MQASVLCVFMLPVIPSPNLTKHTSINLTLPFNSSIDCSLPVWPTDLLDQCLATVDTFSKYNNVLVFGVGNRVVNGSSNTNIAPFIKAVA